MLTLFEVLDRVGSHKHLGVTLEPDLSWDTHLKKVINHANLKMSIHCATGADSTLSVGLP